MNSPTGKEMNTGLSRRNLLKVGGGQQVMLEVKIAEIARSELRSMDAQFNAIWKGSSWTCHFQVG